jgi:hypothetical protein
MVACQVGRRSHCLLVLQVLLPLLLLVVMMLLPLLLLLMQPLPV